MEEMRAFCDKLAAKAKQKSTSAGNVKAFTALYGGNNLSGGSDVEKTSRSLARRNDVRVQPYLGVNIGTSVAAGTNVFADSGLHVHAAAWLAAFAQGRAGLDATMPSSEVLMRLQAYISELTNAPHWIFVANSSRTVTNDGNNPREFTRRLIAGIEDDLKATEATQGIAAATNSVSLLASTLSSSGDISDTLYAAIGIIREAPESGPVLYSISFTSLRMNHERYRKSSPLAAEAQTNTWVLQLDSPMLVQYAAQYYSLIPQSSLEDWFHSLNI